MAYTVEMDLVDIDMDPSYSEQTQPATERDPIYYCENAVLQAEDRIFCVPKSGLLEHGTFFQHLLRKTEHTIKGSSDSHPIVLEGVSKIDFHNLLRLLYPFRGVDSPTGDEHWLGILDLATKWGFEEIRSSALLHLEHIFISTSPFRDPVHALFLCQKYDIHEHIKHQFETIITSITPLDRTKILANGINEETVLSLMQLREKWFCGMMWGDKGSGTGAEGILPPRLTARRIVEEHFALSFTSESSAPLETSKTKEELEAVWRAEETKRLSIEVKRLEEMEKQAIEAEKSRREQQERDERNAKEEEERKAKEEEEKREKDGAKGLNSEEDEIDIQAASVVDDDNDSLDDIQSVTSDISIFPTPKDSCERLNQLIRLHAEKYLILDKTRSRALEETGPKKRKSRIPKLTRVLETCNIKIDRAQADGTRWPKLLPSNCKDNAIVLRLCGKAKTRQLIEEMIESLMGSKASSLSFSVELKATAIQRKEDVSKAYVYQTLHLYYLAEYAKEAYYNQHVTLVDVPTENFSEWLTTCRENEGWYC